MRIAPRRRPANPRPIDPLAESGSYLVGHDRNRGIRFDDIRRQPDPEWSRPTAARQQAWAQGRAEAAYAVLGPYGSVAQPAEEVRRLAVRGHRVLNEIEDAVAEMRDLCEAVRAGVVQAARRATTVD